MIDKIIHNYKIEGVLGEGGMGVVYKAKDLHLERTVALKMLHQKLSNQPNLLERFRGEALFMAKLNHPNIAVLYNFISHENDFYMVMEYVEGMTLETILKRVHKLSVQNAVRIIVQGLEGLKHAHQKGILHRDIKPANLMVTPEGVVKLMDFGIARADNETPRLTQANRIIGTLEYMAPELIKGQPPSPQSDMYSMGVLLYELLSGTIPFESNTEYELMNNIVNQPPKPLSGIPTDILKVLTKAMSKKQEDRYMSIQAFQDDLTKIVKPGPIDTQEWKNITKTFSEPVQQTAYIHSSPAPTPQKLVSESYFVTYKKELMVLGGSVLMAVIIILWASSSDDTSLAETQNTPQIEALKPTTTAPEQASSLPTTQQPEESLIKRIEREKSSQKNIPTPLPKKTPGTTPYSTPKKEVIQPNNPVVSKPVEESPKSEPKRKFTTTLLYGGTSISFRLAQTISSADAYKKQEVRFVVSDNVVIGNEIVIPKGSPVIGIVTSVRASEGRKRGVLEIEIFSIDAEHNQKVVMRNAILKEVSDSDSDVRMSAGKEFVGVTRKDVVISLY